MRGKFVESNNFQSFLQQNFYSFFGIPYGKSPANTRRFTDPVKVTPWRNVLDATSEKEGCVQFSLLHYEFMGTEDCLFNNIHVPKLPCKKDILRPVIVNIHPGAYSFGSPRTEFYGSPEFIMHNDVIYVCISFRLHILGFLNLGLKECSGNQGIKDIILSLQWIKSNIRSFGGDPENVTLLGSCTGAMIIHALMLSPSVKGLFHKAVLMGAYLTIPNVIQQESNVSHAQETAVSLGYDGDPQDHKKLLTFLKKQEPQSLIHGIRQRQKVLQETMAPILPIGVFGPSLDQGDILPESPRKLIATMTRIPIMIGFSEIESIMGFVRNTSLDGGVLGDLRTHTERNFKTSFRQNCFGWGYHLDDDDVHLINTDVEAFYLDRQPIEKAPLYTKMDIQTDIFMSDAYDTVINPVAANLPSSVYIYKFQFEGNIHSMNTILKTRFTEPLKGAFHGSDFCYWNRFGDPQDKETHKMVKNVTKLITTFAKTGDPNHEDFPVRWKPSTPDDPCYLSINNPSEMVDGKLNNDRLQFWDNIKRKYRTE
ncbi:esterase E4-like isoform X2 [Planococcus citri]|uniref:esterase E4-like isoform X2 n=1 Tax=Planococcus citri TaxID=170843 RepID=UPI0031FA1AB9